MSTTIAGQPLTSREVEVLHHIALGLDQESVGRAMGLTPATIKTHMARILRKLEAVNAAHAVSIAYQDRIFELPAFPDAVVRPIRAGHRRREQVPAATVEALEACARAADAGKLKAAQRFGRQALAVIDKRAGASRQARVRIREAA